jgi:hypothetical protein
MGEAKHLECDGTGELIHYGASAVENGWQATIGRLRDGEVQWELIGRLHKWRDNAERAAHARAWSIARGFRI